MLGLPGNPVASLVCSHLFLKPLLAGSAAAIIARTSARHDWARRCTANDLRQDYVRAVVREDDGGLVATPFGIQDFFDAEDAGRCQRADRARAVRACRRGGNAACSVLMLR